MRNKRMFSMDVVDSDAFLDMPVSAQNLYFHLGMRADDDGFLAGPKRVLRMLGAQDDDLKLLFAKRFLLSFEEGICVIKHWQINNTIRSDRYFPTKYTEYKNMLKTKDNGAYTEIGIPLVNHSVPEKRREEKRREEKRPLPLKKTIKYLSNIPGKDVRAITERFDLTEADLKKKAESLKLYCQSKGKRYKNYYAFLLNAVKKDYREFNWKEKEERTKLPKLKPRVDEKGEVVVVDGKVQMEQV